MRSRGSASPRVAVIGAGLAGVLTAVKLKQTGIDDFTVFEKEDGPGGVWWKNTYPGCEVDVPSLAYSFSFMPYDWARTHATQPELRQYVQKVIDRYGVAAHFRYGVAVKTARWRMDTRTYTIEAESGSMGEFDVVVSCLGMLSHPQIPRWPNMDSFRGPVFHTSAYEHHHDLTGKTVAVVGTGSTACQLVPALAPVVGRLDLYQEEPGYVLPKRNIEYTPEERRKNMRFRPLQRLRRILLIRSAQKLAGALDVGHERNKKVAAHCRGVIESTVRDPATRQAVTPDYAYGCKRPVLASTFYPTLNEPNVTLVPHRVSDFTESGLVDATGVERSADIVVLATGFQAANYLATLDVHGPEGRSLHDVWGGEPTAFLGITVPGFPNFFMLYGPNTNGGWSVVTQLEIQVRLIVRMIRKGRRGSTVIDTRPGVAVRYDRWVQKGIADKLSSLTTGCINYYTSATGKNVTQWPHTHFVYLAAVQVLGRVGLVRRAGPRPVGQPEGVVPGSAWTSGPRGSRVHR